MDNKISVIVPVYNVERYLRECLDSVLHQTFENFDVILINDGSRDDSGKICDEYALKDERIKVIHKPNSGVSDTRNTGIKESSGQYVVFVDSDDTVHPQYLEVLYKEISNGNFDCVICGYKVVMTKGCKDVCINEPIIINDIKSNKSTICSIYNQKLLNSPWNKIYRREKIASYFDSSMAMGEDLAFNLQFTKNCNSIKIIQDVLYNYVIHQNSAVTTYKTSRMNDVIKMNNMLIDYFCDSDCIDNIINSCVGEVDGLLRHLFRGGNTKNERKEIIKTWCSGQAYIEFCKKHTKKDSIFLAESEKIYKYYNRKTWLERKIVKFLYH